MSNAPQVQQISMVEIDARLEAATAQRDEASNKCITLYGSLCVAEDKLRSLGAEFAKLKMEVAALTEANKPANAEVVK